MSGDITASGLPYDTLEESLEKGYYAEFPEEVIARIKSVGFLLSTALSSGEIDDQLHRIDQTDGHSYTYSFHEEVGGSINRRRCLVEYATVCRAPVYFRINMWYDRNTNQYITITTH
jgi:hypothetical protein